MQNYSLEKNSLLHLCISEPLRRGIARVIIQNKKGVLVHAPDAGLHLLAADDEQTALELIREIRNPYFVMLCNAEFAPLLSSFRFPNHMYCRQAAWLKAEKPIPDPRLSIAPPDDRAFERILETYHMDTPEELCRRRAAGELFFARDKNGRDAGFVGLHPEGCFGLLHVFEEQRGRGYGEALEKHIIRFCMESGRIPYCQVNINNLPSLALQQKTGLQITSEILYMAWHDA